MGEFVLTRKTIRNGHYEGQLNASARLRSAPELALRLPDGSVTDVRVDAVTNEPKTWNVWAEIPGIDIEEGVQTYLVQDSSTGKTLDSFAVVCGDPLQDDLRTEIALIRAELDILKASFRKHVVASQR